MSLVRTVARAAVAVMVAGAALGTIAPAAGAQPVVRPAPDACRDCLMVPDGIGLDGCPMVAPVREVRPFC